MSDRLDPVSLARRLGAAGRLSHAYLITGPAGSGKHALAQALAAALVCQGEERPCGRCPHCKKAAAGIHPDVITVGPAEGKRDILVDQIRQIRADVYIRPNEAGRKVYLIDPASALNPSAQNALLKILEEGPAYAAFLLLAEAAGSLLPTIRSRCEEISLTPPPVEEEGEDPEAAALAELLLSGGEEALMARCVALEKLDRDGLQDLLNGTILCLERRMRTQPAVRKRGMETVEQLKTLSQAAQFNVGVGHLTGWLCAGHFSTM